MKISRGNYCTSTPHRSETNGIAERAVRRIKEGTSAVLLQTGLDEKWWADSMECNCNLRNIQDLVSDGKTPYERRFGVPLKWRGYSVWSDGGISPYFRYRPVATASARSNSLAGFWKGYVMLAEIEELEQMDASEIYATRLNAKEVLTPMSGDKFIFPIADGTVKISGGDQVLRTSTLMRDRPDRGEEQSNRQRRIRRIFFNPTQRLIVVWW